MKRRLLTLACALASMLFASGAWAGITLEHGWMRPVAAGAASADAYVDVQSTTALTLVKVTTPWAQNVDMLSGAVTDNEYVTQVHPEGFDVEANVPLRFARMGNVLRLNNLKRNALIGDKVRLKFTFRDAHQRRSTAETDILVRGVFNPAAAAAQP